MDVPQIGRSRKVDFNMTPMIDVVFLLIIFFLVSSHLAQQETHRQLDLPRAESGHDPSPREATRVTINILADGQVLLGGDRVAAGELDRRLQVERQETDGQLEIRLRSDRMVPYRVVEPILLACAQAGIWDVSFAVYKKAERGERRAEIRKASLRSPAFRSSLSALCSLLY
jgi:biopolymer transport protein ExbD